MRPTAKRSLVCLLVAAWPTLAGAAAPADELLRPAPATPEASDAINGLLSGMAAVTTRFADGNADLCAKGDMRCHITLTIRDVNSISIQPVSEGMSLTVPLLQYVKNDDELAFVLAHEQAHRLLRQAEAKFTPAMEATADCLGAFLVTRAGFNAVKGAETIRRVAKGASREEKAFVASGEFALKLDSGERYQAIQRAAAMTRAGTGREAMEQACGVTL